MRDKSIPFHLSQPVTLVVSRVSAPQKLAKQYAIKGVVGFVFFFFPVVHGILHKTKPIVRVLKPEIPEGVVLRLEAELAGRQTSQLQ